MPTQIIVELITGVNLQVDRNCTANCRRSRRLYRKRERTFIKIAVVIIISEGTFLLGQLGKREKDGDALKVVQMKNGVETPVNYQGLSQAEKENALADILVKSAIEQVLEIHKQVKQNAILEAEASSRLRVKHEA